MKKLTALFILIICMLPCFAQTEEAYIDFSQEEFEDILFTNYWNQHWEVEADINAPGVDGPKSVFRFYKKDGLTCMSCISQGEEYECGTVDISGGFISDEDNKYFFIKYTSEKHDKNSHSLIADDNWNLCDWSIWNEYNLQNAGTPWLYNSPYITLPDEVIFVDLESFEKFFTHEKIADLNQLSFEGRKYSNIINAVSDGKLFVSKLEKINLSFEKQREENMHFNVSNCFLNENSLQGEYDLYVDNQYNGSGTIKLVFDGDYISLYENHEFIKTFCRITPETWIQINRFQKTNTVNPKKIVFPRHADGKSDFDDKKIIPEAILQAEDIAEKNDSEV